MDRAQIAVSLILPLVRTARRLIGEDAVKIANEIPGLEVTPDNEIELTGDGIAVYEKLLKAYEEKLHGELLLEFKVGVNVYRSSGREVQQQ